MSNPTRVIAEVVTETFNDHIICFHSGDAFMNLTTMCQGYGKRPNDFLNLPSTNAFIKALEADTNQLPENLVLTQRGQNGGTWAHPDLALECARWLSPQFAIWTNRVIRELLNKGKVELAPPTAPSPMALPATPEEPPRYSIYSFKRKMSSWERAAFGRFMKNFANSVGLSVTMEQNPYFGPIRSYPASLLSEAMDMWHAQPRRLPKIRNR